MKSYRIVSYNCIYSVGIAWILEQATIPSWTIILHGNIPLAPH